MSVAATGILTACGLGGGSLALLEKLAPGCFPAIRSNHTGGPEAIISAAEWVGGVATFRPL